MPATKAPEGDVIQVLLNQHEQIRELFGQLHNAKPAARRHVFDQLRRLLAVHEAAEEMIVRPLTRTTSGGNRIAGARNHEEHMATHLLAELENMDPGSREFIGGLPEFEAKVTEHAEHEEKEEFPLISRTRTDQQRALLGRALQVAETIAPTHSHPAAAGSTAAQYALWPFASLLDHARDVMSRSLPK